LQYRGRSLTVRVLVVMAVMAICQFSLLETSASAATTPLTFSVSSSSKDGGRTFETVFRSSRNLYIPYLFDVELFDANNKRVYQSYEILPMRETRTMILTRIVPTHLAPGTYTVKAGWFRTDWTRKYLWDDNAGTVTVGQAPAPTTTTSTTQPTTTSTTQLPTTTTTAPTTTTTAPTNDLPGWKYIFGDAFDTNAAEGSFLSTYKNWGAYDTGWPDTSRRGMYDTNIISTNNGLMNIRLHTGADGKPRAAVPFPLINGSGSADETNQLYGRYEMRFRADEIPGYKTAFLLWPKSEVWPRDGEIDFAEGGLDGHIEGFVHRQDATWGGDQAAFSTSARYGSWHTSVIEWTPTHVTFILDGQVVGKTTTRIPNTPMHWVLQTETCLNGCAIPANVTGNVQFDYVKVWKYDPS
jgi:hypothetical protein